MTVIESSGNPFDDLIDMLEVGDFEEPLYDENGKRWGTQHYSTLTEDSVKHFKLILSHQFSQAYLHAQNKLDLTKPLTRHELLELGDATLRHMGLTRLQSHQTTSTKEKE